MALLIQELASGESFVLVAGVLAILIIALLVTVIIQSNQLSRIAKANVIIEEVDNVRTITKNDIKMAVKEAINEIADANTIAPT